jgi:hypothetical protein
MTKNEERLAWLALKSKAQRFVREVEALSETAAALIHDVEQLKPEPTDGERAHQLGQPRGVYSTDQKGGN